MRLSDMPAPGSVGSAGGHGSAAAGLTTLGVGAIGSRRALAVRVLLLLLLLLVCGSALAWLGGRASRCVARCASGRRASWSGVAPGALEFAADGARSGLGSTWK
jgi:hypothetical protein